MQKSRILSSMGGGGSSEPLQGLAAGMPPPTKKELAQALDVASRFDVHIAQVTLQPLQRRAPHRLQAMASNVYAHLLQCGAIVTIPALAVDTAATPACTAFASRFHAARSSSREHETSDCCTFI